jgi:hypothetical protein
MTTGGLRDTLRLLKDNVHRLAVEELDGKGNPGERYRRAGLFREQLAGLRPEVDAAPAAARPELDDLWRAVDRDLIFLEAMAAAAAPPAPPARPDVRELARQINVEAFELAKAAAAGPPGAGEREQEARALDRRLKDLVGQPGHSAPDVQQLLGEAGLDLAYVLAGGRGATSVRLHHYLQGRAG